MTQKLLKGYLIVIRAIRTISCKWSCGQRVALFLFIKTKTMKKNLKPVDIFIQNFVKVQKDCYYQLLKEMKAKKKSKLLVNKA